MVSYNTGSPEVLSSSERLQNSRVHLNVCLHIAKYCQIKRIRAYIGAWLKTSYALKEKQTRNSSKCQEGDQSTVI